jgi:hypothetical protein
MWFNKSVLQRLINPQLVEVFFVFLWWIVTPVVYCNHMSPSNVRITPINLLMVFFSVKIWCSYPRPLSLRATPLRQSATVCSVCCQLHFMLCDSQERVEHKQQTTLQYVSNEYPSCTEAFSSFADNVTVKDSNTIFSVHWFQPYFGMLCVTPSSVTGQIIKLFSWILIVKNTSNSVDYKILFGNIRCLSGLPAVG